MNLQELITGAFAEDIPQGDITTSALGVTDSHGLAHLIAKQDLTLSGKDVFDQCLNFVDPDLKSRWNFQDGDSIYNGQTLCQIEGNLIQLLKAERVALNFLGHLSGIASKTHTFVKACEGTQCKILDTRKTLPLYRELSKKAVVDGGGTNHRMNLSDGILIKENHLQVGGGLEKTIAAVRTKTDLPIEVEVKNLDEVQQAITLGVQRIMLDNMSMSEMAKAIGIIPQSIEVEASGNMTLDRIPQVAKLGVNFISVGALTHSVDCADISLLFDWS